MTQITAQTAKFYHNEHARYSFGYHLNGDVATVAFAFRNPTDQPNRKVAVNTIVARLNGQAGTARSPNASRTQTLSIAAVKEQYPNLGTNAALNQYLVRAAENLYPEVLVR